MKQYLDILNNIMENGVDRKDRTGVGTRSLFTQQMRFNLKDGFPAVTTKKLAWKSVVSELLWMIEGSGDERRLAEILYGKPREELADKNTIWTANAQADYWKTKAKFDGDLGDIYGVMWRNFPAYDEYGSCGDYSVVDQLSEVIERIKTKPWDRRHIVSAWHPGRINNMALPPCHMIFQFYVANDELSCHMFQRSADYPLGVPFNIASYALLTHMIAQICNLGVYELIITTGDSHIYYNQFDQVNEQLKRIPSVLPTLWLNPEIKNIDDFTMDDIKLKNYNPQDEIKFQFSV